jgi:lysyl-tRNA synthetase class 2
MELTDLEKIRVEKLEKLRSLGIEPYPTRAHPTHTTRAAAEAFIRAEEASQGGDTAHPVQVTLAGRIRSIRLMGKIAFAHIEDGSGRIQLFLRTNELGEETMALFKEYFDLGDFIEAEGVMVRTRTGEITLQVHSFRMLAKAISPLPAAKDEVVDGQVVRHATLSDPETRYRQRYADLAVNPEVREVFRVRAKTVSAIRNFLDSHDFLEVETPILQPIYGGAAAKPFITHHNQLKQDLFLRISFELYLKRLLVGGYERVYEIGRDFRNEGVSFKHNPEFTQLEFYIAYADYLKIMDMTEQMIVAVCDTVLGTRLVKFNGHEIDFNPPWRRLELRQGLIEAVGIDIAQHPTTESLAQAMRAKELPVNPDSPRGKLIDGLLGDYLEPNLVQPTFLYDYPRDIRKLALLRWGASMRSTMRSATRWTKTTCAPCRWVCRRRAASAWALTAW